MSSNPFCSHCGRGPPITTLTELSPVNELLISNQPPSSPQRERSYTFIERIQEDIGTIDEEISKAQAVMEGLLAKRKRLRKLKRCHKAIMAPIRRLPAELLSEIFILCLPPFPTRIFRANAPLLLEQICQPWRDIARSTPGLWSSICLCLGPETIDFDVNVARTWPARSGICPLSIALGIGRERIEEEEETHPALPILFASSFRWVDLELALPDPWIKSFDAVKEQVLLLKKLAVTFNPFHNGTAKAFEHAHNLRTLEVKSFVNFQRNWVVVPWHNLTKFVAEDKGTYHVLDTLRGCPNLVECVLRRMLAKYISFESNIKPFELVHLRSLQIEIPAWSSKVFDSLTLPSLRDITLVLLPGGDDRVYWKSRVAFVAMLSRSGCALQCLSLHGVDILIDDDDLLTCLEAAPSLVQLIIGGSPLRALNDELLRRLTPVKSRVSQSQIACLVPRLEILRIEFEHRHFREETFLRMVRLRWKLGAAGSPLAKLHTVGLTLTGKPYRPHGILTRLRELKEDGLRVDLKMFSPPSVDSSLLSS